MNYLQSSPRFCPHPQWVSFQSAATAIADKSAVKARHKISSALTLVLDRVVWHGSFIMFKTRKGDGFAQFIDKESLARVKRRDRKNKVDDAT
jgi:hypothetical protein